MTLRLRRSIRLAPGIRLNFGKTGMSVSAGVRGASVTVGKRGTYVNAGIPGSGVSVRRRVSGGSSRNTQSKAAERVELSVITRLNDDGSVDFLDSEEQPLSEALIKIVKRDRGDKVRDWLQDQCEKINHPIEALKNLYLDTPSPNQRPVFVEAPFNVTEPAAPTIKPLGLWGRLFKGARAKIEAENAASMRIFQQESQSWRQNRERHVAREQERKLLIEQRLYSDSEAMYQFMEERLQAIDWPRETNVSFELSQSGERVLADVDLPEVEDMPTKTATLPSRGWKLSLKELSETDVRKLYMEHIHGIGFRLIGEFFANLPTLNEVTLSAYSQRANKSTGNIEDEYLYSVRVTREAWAMNNFNNLDALDITQALERFELVRNMTKTGVFKPIRPFTTI